MGDTCDPGATTGTCPGLGYRRILARVNLSKFRLWRATGSTILRNELVMENIGIVHKVIRTAAPGKDYPDLLQAGTIGLMTALDRFEPSKGAFITFAKWHVLHEIQCAILQAKGKTRSRKTKERSIHLVREILGWDDLETDGQIGSRETALDLRKALDGLSEQEKLALLGAVEGETVTEASERMSLYRPNSHIINAVIVVGITKARANVRKGE